MVLPSLGNRCVALGAGTVVCVCVGVYYNSGSRVCVLTLRVNRDQVVALGLGF